MSQRPQTAGSILGGDFLARMERLIEKAPDGPAQEHPMLAPQSLLRLINGWPAKYIETVELRDEDGWLAKLEAAKSVVAAGGLLALIGNRGTGKTRMAAELARAGYYPDDQGVWNGNRMTTDKTPLYRRAMDVFLEFRATMTQGSKTSLLSVVEGLEKPGLLVIDEFHEAGESSFEKSGMTNLLDRRYAEDRPTILIANFDADALGQALGPSIADRMHENGKILRFGGQSFRRQKP